MAATAIMELDGIAVGQSPIGVGPDHVVLVAARVSLGDVAIQRLGRRLIRDIDSHRLVPVGA
jgi:hypothetical protein